jgi:hypothetical protein
LAVGDAAANDTMIRAFVSAWERRDTAHIVDAFADDGVYHSIPLTPIVGKTAIRAFVLRAPPKALASGSARP